MTPDPGRPPGRPVRMSHGSIILLILLIAGITAGCITGESTGPARVSSQGAIPAPSAMTLAEKPMTIRTVTPSYSPSQATTAITATGTASPADRAIPRGILIDSIDDHPAGRPLLISGRTSLAAGTELLVVIVPSTMEDGQITGDFSHVKQSSVTDVTSGSSSGNRFSVNVDTAGLVPAEYLVFVTDRKDEPSGKAGKPSGVTASVLFNIVP